MTTEKYIRKCPNWLETFTRWCLPRSEAPENFIIWTGIFTIACALRRHVKVPKEWFGSWEASPNVYILFVAPPGRARKSTTANYSEDLLEALPRRISKAPTLVTQASLLTGLVNSDDSSLYIMSAEFGSFILKSGVEMFTFLTDMFDGRKYIESTTISRGLEFAEKPCINLLAATTPIWIAENMPESVIGGGFASRVIFIFEPNVRRRQLYYNELDFTYLNKLRSDLISDLQHIADDIHGDFDISDEGKVYMEHWYKVNADAGEKGDQKMSGYFERKPAHIHKLAMILHVAHSDSMTLSLKDFQDSITLLEIVEKKLHRIFDPIGKNVYAPDMMTIYEYIKEKGAVSYTEFKREFYAVATPNLLDELIVGLMQAGFIRNDNGTLKPIEAHD